MSNVVGNDQRAELPRICTDPLGSPVAPTLPEGWRPLGPDLLYPGVVVVVVSPCGELLLVEDRSDDPTYPDAAGTVSFVGGSIEDTDGTVWRALERELQEELGDSGAVRAIMEFAEPALFFRAEGVQYPSSWDCFVFRARLSDEAWRLVKAVVDDPGRTPDGLIVVHNRDELRAMAQDPCMIHAGMDKLINSAVI